ncbi:MAG: hypothetical protein GYB31_02995 [Bacteroidetes bacterium]|nr:hypothetical protein [Bacteroidota bacterium]
MRLASLLILSFIAMSNYAQPGVLFITPFEQDPNYSASYLETIEYYRSLSDAFRELKMVEYGQTDSGYPLHALVFSVDGDFDPKSVRESDKTVLMVNNAIHPGEPCGVDASMMLIRDLLLSDEKATILKDMVLVVIPFYNIGGGLNRGAYSRANQVGPAEHGFRGNARNYDLNRDFIKADTRNARAFAEIYQDWQPHVFIDNHTSNGADYQYTLTLIPTHPDKLQQPLAAFLEEEMLPAMYARMKEAQWEMTPYVYVRNTPDEGIAGFLDLPRYSTGYTGLFHSIGFMPETHMLKPFEDRVWSVYHFMDQMIQYLSVNGGAVRNAKQLAIRQTKEADKVALNWTLDFDHKDSLLFKGYEAQQKPSAISGLDRLYYDRDKPFEKYVPFFNTYKTTLEIEKPNSYIIPQAYTGVIDRLQANGVKMYRIETDWPVDVEQYYIRDYETTDNAYEGHYLHSKVEVEKVRRIWTYRTGDYLVPMGQAADLYIVSVLEPQAPDSFFAWNFFDGILMQKEYFSSYVFEDRALELLEENSKLKEEFEAAREADATMQKSARAQLDWIYRHSPHYEQTHNLYPVGRVME